jgi:signal peptidase I
MRRILKPAATALLAGIVAVLAWAGVTDRVAYVVTNGISMQPLYHADDLVVLARQDSYRVGDIVAYRAKGMTVLHRIVDGDAAAGWVTKGDNNGSIDPPRPTSAELLGRAVVHVPQGGAWLRRVYSAPILAAAAFLILIGTGQTVRHRRRRRRTAMGKSALPDGLAAGLPTTRLRAAAGGIAAVALVAALVGVTAGLKPPTTTLTVQSPVTRSMTFSYAATVPLTSAYDGTEVVAPDPVFRSVTDTVDVSFAYRGPSGQVEVDAELSIANGWHSTVPLLGERPADGTGAPATVRLDLGALAHRATAGAKATGTRADAVKITIVPRVSTGSGAPFAPALHLQLTPSALALEIPGSTLTVDDVAPAPRKVSVPQVVALAGHDLISVGDARVLSAVLLLGALLAAAVLLLVARRSAPQTEDEQILRQYGPLLVEVQPMAAPTDRAVVEVTAFRTLVRLAERYHLLILHWTADGSTTFTVHDDTTAYRYTTGEVPQLPHWQWDTSAATDELTDLPDRSLFESEVQYAIDAGGGAGLCLMLIDIDNLDDITDDHGPTAGDTVLVGMAERLRRAVRPTDLVARLAGGGFAVLFENVGRAAVDSVAKRVLRVAHESMLVGVDLLAVRVSLGVVQGDPDQDATELLARAACALAEAKAESSTHYAWFDADGSALTGTAGTKPSTRPSPAPMGVTDSR